MSCQAPKRSSSKSVSAPEIITILPSRSVLVDEFSSTHSALNSFRIIDETSKNCQTKGFVLSGSYVDPKTIAIEVDHTCDIKLTSEFGENLSPDFSKGSIYQF